MPPTEASMNTTSRSSLCRLRRTLIETLREVIALLKEQNLPLTLAYPYATISSLDVPDLSSPTPALLLCPLQMTDYPLNERTFNRQGLPDKNKATGFTLVELLVAVGIVAALVALCLPGSLKAIEVGKSAKCASNLKQLGAAFQMYAGDHDGTILTLNEVSSPGGNSRYWPNSLTPYIAVTQWRYAGAQAWGDTIEGVYHCPSATAYYNGGGYGVSELHLAKPGRITKIFSITRPTQLWLVGDALIGRPPKSKTSASVWCPLDSSWGSGNGYEAAPRHNGKSNVCFVDGHVEPVLYSDLKTNKNDIFGHYGF